MTVLGIIPARAGSKGVPHKNLALVGGRPLIAWTIDAARRSRGMSRLIVTTDCDEIAQTALSCGAEVPFMRPTDLAQDDTPGIAPILHACRWLEQHEDYTTDAVMMLQPTSPLRTEEDIDDAIRIMEECSAVAVVSVTPVTLPPHWMKRVDQDGAMRDFLASAVPARRQDIEPIFGLNGAIYLAHRDALL